nr:PREDICTED: uncharacterized protein LOC105661763 [Megachile rotundata]
MKLLILFWTIVSFCEGYRILGLFPYHGRSHFVMFEQLMKSLARKGHQVEVISTFPLKTPYPNYTDVVAFEVTQHIVNNVTFEQLESFTGLNAGYTTAWEVGNPICDRLNTEGVQRLLKNAPHANPPYDLAIVEVGLLLSCDYCGLW